MGNEADIVRRLKQILGKYEQEKGIMVAGTEDATVDGTMHVLRVDSTGKLQISGVDATLEVNLDAANDEVTVYGSQGQALQQRASSNDLLVQLRNAGSEIDPRDRNWSLTETVNVDLTANTLAVDFATSAKQDTMITALQLIDDLQNALNSVGTDRLLVGDAGAIINLDATGDVQVDVLSSALPSGAATEATLSSIDGNDFATETTLSSIDGKDFATASNQSSMITALQLIDDLRNALNSVGSDQLLVNVNSPYNAETEDDSIPASESRETQVMLLYGYNTTTSAWKRVNVDDSGKLKVTT